MRLKPEDQELIKFFEWVRWQEKFDPRFESIYHVENERKCSYAAGVLRKRKGVRAGIMDIIVPIPKDPWCGLTIEMKYGNGRPTQEQVKMQKLFHSLGHCVRTAWSADEAKEIVQIYMKGI